MSKKSKLKLFIIFFLLIIIIINKNIFQLILNKYINRIDISIIIPVYNTEKYLNFSLKSITEQSLKNIEIICIDDGSVDNSLKILRNYQEKDGRLIIINQKNQGAAKARNRGIKISKGKFISFMDSDDLYPNKYILELMLDTAIEKNALICGGGLLSFIFKNNKINIIKTDTSFQNNEFIPFSKYQYDYYFTRFIYNKKFLRKYKLLFPNYLYYEDPPFFIKSMIKAKYFYSLKNITYFRRIIKKPMISNELQAVDLFRGIKFCLDISKSNNLYKLYYIILLRLNSFIKATKKFFKNRKIKILILDIINNINLNMLKKGNYRFKIPSIS